MDIKFLERGKGVQLSAHINQDEIDCRCTEPDCQYTVYDRDTLEDFELLRISCGHGPIRVLSGFRCQRHNFIVGGVALSKHKMGLGLDLEKKNDLPIEEFTHRARKFFDVVLPRKDKNYIHCHNEPF